MSSVSSPIFASFRLLDSLAQRAAGFLSKATQLALQPRRRGTIPRGLILLYHRVADLRSDPALLSVTPQHFAEHLDILRRYWQPISLQEMVHGLRVGRLPNHAVALTFDDGYADNLFNAKPLLERRDVTATVFVTTAELEQPRDFWWDELEGLLLHPGTLPRCLRLSVAEATHEWDLGSVAHYDDEAYQRFRRWSVAEDSSPTARHEVYRCLSSVVRALSYHEREGVLAQLRASRQTTPSLRDAPRRLTSAEVLRLAENGSVEIGSHTVTQPLLAALSRAEQQIEISQSKLRLEEILGRPVLSFAYPFGSRSDYTPQTVHTVRDSGFTCACSNFGGLVVPYTDAWQLPRHMVLDWDGEEFAARLHQFCA